MGGHLTACGDLQRAGQQPLIEINLPQYSYSIHCDIFINTVIPYLCIILTLMKMWYMKLT